MNSENSWYYNRKAVIVPGASARGAGRRIKIAHRLAPAGATGGEGGLYHEFSKFMVQ